MALIGRGRVHILSFRTQQSNQHILVVLISSEVSFSVAPCSGRLMTSVFSEALHRSGYRVVLRTGEFRLAVAVLWNKLCKLTSRFQGAMFSGQWLSSMWFQPTSCHMGSAGEFRPMGCMCTSHRYSPNRIVTDSGLILLFRSPGVVGWAPVSSSTAEIHDERARHRSVLRWLESQWKVMVVCVATCITYLDSRCFAWVLVAYRVIQVAYQSNWVTLWCQRLGFYSMNCRVLLKLCSLSSLWIECLFDYEIG